MATIASEAAIVVPNELTRHPTEFVRKLSGADQEILSGARGDHAREHVTRVRERDHQHRTQSRGAVFEGDLLQWDPPITLGGVTEVPTEPVGRVDLGKVGSKARPILSEPGNRPGPLDSLGEH